MEFMAVIGCITCTWFILKLMLYVFSEWFGLEFRMPWTVREETPAAEEQQEHPCSTCLRWPECNGVDADTCKLLGGERVE